MIVNSNFENSKVVHNDYIDFGLPVLGLFDIPLYYRFCVYLYYNEKKYIKKYINSSPSNIFNYARILMNKSNYIIKIKVFNNKNDVIYEERKSY